MGEGRMRMTGHTIISLPGLVSCITCHVEDSAFDGDVAWISFVLSCMEHDIS